MLSSIISNNKDIFINSDTKPNESFQINQLLFQGFANPIRFRRPGHRDGILLYIREDTVKPLNSEHLRVSKLCPL